MRGKTSPPHPSGRLCGRVGCRGRDTPYGGKCSSRGASTRTVVHRRPCGELRSGTRMRGRRARHCGNRTLAAVTPSPKAQPACKEYRTPGLDSPATKPKRGLRSSAPTRCGYRAAAVAHASAPCRHRSHAREGGGLRAHRRFRQGPGLQAPQASRAHIVTISVFARPLPTIKRRQIDSKDLGGAFLIPACLEKDPLGVRTAHGSQR